MAGIVAARLGLTGALGTTAEHHDGLYTGRLKGELLHGAAKAEAVRALAHEHGLILPAAGPTRIPTTACRCCRSSAIPCDQSDGRLLVHAEEHDWAIRDYRSGRGAERLDCGSRCHGGGGGASRGLAVNRALRR